MQNKKTAAISQSVTRIDARGKVTGETPYPGDIDIEGQLWMRIKFSDRAHARVRNVDASRAEALPGVARVFTSRDVPVNEYGLVIKDQPVLCGPGGAKAGADVVRCYMDMVATVVAETDAIAQAALELIEVQYEDLPAVFDPEAAMAASAPQLHPDAPDNLVARYRIRKGDMKAGWAAADVVVEGEYETTWQEHAYLQPEAGLAYLDDVDRVTVLVAGQWTHEDQEQIYHALDLPPEQVRVIYPAIGGAFGGREDMSVQIILALAAWKLRQPVKIQWSREESILYHHKRHPIKVRAKWGATNEGLLTAGSAEVIGDAGAYNYTSNKVLGNAQLTVTGPYEIPHVHVDTYTVYTNNIPSGAFRGFGAPQALFAAEGQMNRLAAALNMDPLEIRLKNSIREGSIGSVDSPFPAGVTMPQVFEACGLESWWGETESGWRLRPPEQPEDPSKRRGRGLAGGFKNVGFSFGFPEHCWAGIELQGNAEIEKVILFHAAADVGQGAHTALNQMAADAVGVPFDRVEILASDTATSGSSGSASASRLTFMSGNAIRGAAEIARRKWQDEERPARGEYMYRPPATTPFDPQTGRAEPNFAYGYVAEAVEVEVDIETGQVQVLEVVCANDVGKVVNPQQLQGQIEGAIVQAQGYALMEYLVSEEGRIRNPFLSTYLIPTSLDVPPRIKSVILENPDPIGPWGVRGMAEMPFLPLAPAIAAAIYDATGVWIDSQPFTAQKVVKALRQRGIGAL
ncbi:MAG: xanthine dehydrogenase family protein molybdopterin-binding subunit [Chloroflexota bacterium]|nr:xanthine dehydrogenase family protein molybdopterin-binding subunit [Chloroflexota bacterium]MDE2948183.1 xanthine dehydrogenase family protein molybdopterin-binding subunit [Chloroflexota bacterium]